MAEHSRIKCPCCGKQLYLVTAGDEDDPIVFASMFFPSSADTARAEQAGPQPLVCPLTGKEIDLDSAQSNLVGSHHDTTVVVRRRTVEVPELPRPGGASSQDGGAVSSYTAPVTPAAPAQPEELSTGRVAAILAEDRDRRILRCAECRVMYDLQQTAVCPRCGAAPPVEGDEAGEGDRKDPGSKILRGGLRKLKERSESESPRRPASNGGLPLFFLRHGRAFTIVILLALAASTAGSFLAPTEVVKLVCAVIAALLFVAGYGLFVAFNRLKKMGYYRAMLEASGDVLAPEMPVEGASGTAPVSGEAHPARVRMPASPTKLGDVRYLGGHPDGLSADEGELWAGPTGIELQGSSQVLSMPARSVERVRASGGRIARTGTVVFFALLYLLLPSGPGEVVASSWASWSPSLHHYLLWSYVAALFALGLLVVVVALGLIRARHHVLSVRYRAGDEHVDVRFKTSFAVAFRARQVIRSG